MEGESAIPEAPTPTTEEAPQTSIGFGFTAVNKGPGFVVVNNAPPPVKKTDSDSPTPKSVPELRPTSDVTTNGHSDHPIKRAPSRDSSTDNGDVDDNNNGRRSKRLKKGMSSGMSIEVISYSPS